MSRLLMPTSTRLPLGEMLLCCAATLVGELDFGEDVMLRT